MKQWFKKWSNIEVIVYVLIAGFILLMLIFGQDIYNHFGWK